MSEIANGITSSNNRKHQGLYDYIMKRLRKIINNKKTILLSPTASGKSLIIYCIIRMMKVLNNRCLLIVPTTNLVEQMYGDFKDYGWDAEKYCHRKYYGYENETDKPVVISTWQSLATFDKSFFT